MDRDLTEEELDLLHYMHDPAEDIYAFLFTEEDRDIIRAKENAAANAAANDPWADYF